jgi:hypothetical protein
MSKPDPNGCSRCGVLSCRRPHWTATFDAIRVTPQSTPDGKAAFFEAYLQKMQAITDCETRPAVDWQAELRAATTPREPVARGTISAIRLHPGGLPSDDTAVEALFEVRCPGGSRGLFLGRRVEVFPAADVAGKERR